MRILLPLLAVLSACKPAPPDLSAITAQIAALREEIQDVKKANQPKLEAVEAMDDLAKEVKQLRQKIATPPPAPPPAAPLPAVLNLKSVDLTGGVGGSQPQVNDLYWVLTRIQSNGEEKTVLCLYRALGPREGFQLMGVRMLNADFQMVEYYPGSIIRPTVKDILRELEKQKK